MACVPRLPGLPRLLCLPGLPGLPRVPRVPRLPGTERVHEIPQLPRFGGIWLALRILRVLAPWIAAACHGRPALSCRSPLALKDRRLTSTKVPTWGICLQQRASGLDNHRNDHRPSPVIVADPLAGGSPHELAQLVDLVD